MNQLYQVARIIRDLLPHSEQLIKVGRMNEEQITADVDYIAIDSLAPAQPLTRSEAYDGQLETMTHSARMRQLITVDFYGANAYANAQRLQLLLPSDRSLDLQGQFKVTCFGVSAITDVKQLTGQQYGNRVQVEFVIQYSPSVIIDIMRIDTAQLNFIHD